MVKSYNDPMKQEARAKFRDFIGRNLKRSPKDTRVVCFPGAEVEGEEGLEIKEIYDTLGIPRENIVGLEYSAENAERLERAQMGIEVVCADAYNYFRDTKKRFDVISLDYTGQRTWRESDITRFIAGKHILDRLGIYCTNHMAKREGNPMKEYLLATKLMMENCQQERKEIIGGLDWRELNKTHLASIEAARIKLNEAVSSKQYGEMDELRDYLTVENLLILSDGAFSLDPTRNMFAPLVDWPNSQEDLTAKGISRNFPVAAMDLYYLNSLKTISNLSQMGFSSSQAEMLLRVHTISREEGYLPRDIERWSYNSNKNAKMLTDMVAAKPIKFNLAQRARDLILPDVSGNVLVNPHGMPLHTLRKKARKFEEMGLREGLRIELSRPTYLGSSWVPPKRKEKITREEAIELLEDGCKPAEIAEEYSGFKKMQLAGMLAHITRRKRM